MSGSMSMLAAIALPLLGSALIAAAGARPNLRDTLTMFVAGLTFACNLMALSAYVAGERLAVHLVDILPGLSLSFAAEPLGLAFALLASGLWIVTSLFAFGYMRGHHETHQTRFFVCFSLAIAATLAIAYSANLFSLFIFYEALTLSTFPLVTHHGTDEARRAGRLYLGILMSTSIAFLLFALVWTWQLAGTTEFTPGGILAGKISTPQAAILLALFVFGTGKLAVMPLHRWLPAAMVAPTPVSALLHAVAVVKAGAFTIVKVAVYILGLDVLHEAGSRLWLLPVAAFTILVGATIAIGKDNLKARLAYSTISNLSYIVLGVALANAAGIVGAAMHMVMHAFGKITLFFCAGAIYVAAHETDISKMGGLARRMPLTFIALAIGAASNIGLPLFGGLWSKWFLAKGAVDAGQTVYLFVLMLSSLLALAYLAPIVVRGYFENSSGQSDTNSNLERAHPLLYWPPLLSAAGCIALFIFADDIYNFLTPIVLK